MFSKRNEQFHTLGLWSVFTYNASDSKWQIFFPPDTKYRGIFSKTTSPALQHQLGIQWFSSVLALTTQSLCRPHRLRAQSHKTTHTSDTSRKYWINKLPALPSHLTTSLGFLQHPASESKICGNNSQNSKKHFTNYYQFLTEDTTGNSQMEEI